MSLKGLAQFLVLSGAVRSTRAIVAVSDVAAAEIAEGTLRKGTGLGVVGTAGGSRRKL